jgi:putative ABC transport system permease protein
VLVCLAVRELKVALRTLTRQPWFAMAAIGTLAIGIAAATALFAVVDATLLRPLPYPHYQDIYTVRTTMTDGRFTIGLVASEELSSLRQAAKDGIVAAALTQRADGTILTDAAAYQATSFGVSEEFFDLFGLPMALGRTFNADDFNSSWGTRVILSQRLWRTLFDADPAIVGRTIRFTDFADASAVVVGVAPAAFDVPHDADLWFAQHSRDNVGHTYDGYVRLKPGLAPAAIQSGLAPMWDQLARKYPEFEQHRVFTMRPLLQTLVGDLGPILLIAFAAAGLLFLLAMANVANLLLARSATRKREIAIRTALGASRGDLLRSLMTESFVIALGATAIGLPLAYAAIRAIVLVGGTAFPRVDGMRLDPRVFLFSAFVMIVAGLLVGVTPAATMASANLAELSNEGGRGGLHGRATRRLLGAMVIAEVTIAVALVAGAARLVLSMAHLMTIDPGFTSEGRLAVDVALPRNYFVGARNAAWLRDAEERMRRVGATSVAVASSLPLRHEWDSTVIVNITGHPTDAAHQPNARLRIVSPELFDVLKIKRVAGRTFTRDDRFGGNPVVVINRAWARTFIPDLDPFRVRVEPSIFFERVGTQTIRHDAAIVGIVENVPYADLTKEADPTIYVSNIQVPRLKQTLVVTAADGHPERLVRQIRNELATLDPQVPVEFELLSHVVSTSLTWPTLGLLLMSTFGAAGLILAAIGVFGVIAFVAAQRSGEMAVRLALGAPRSHVFRLVVAQSGLLAVQGLACGLLLAWWMGQLMGKYVYHVGAANAFVLAGSAVVVMAACLGATLPSARRAATIAPAEVLKS